MTPEGKVKQQIKAYLTELGAYQFWPVQMGMGATTVDCLACVNGRFFGIEVKRAGVTEATPRQNHVLKLIGGAKGVAFVTDSFARAKKFIDDFGLGLYNPDDGEMRLRGCKKTLYDALTRFPEGIGSDRLYDILYRDSRDPPEEKALTVHINQLNKTLAAWGQKVRCTNYGRGIRGTYRLFDVPRQTP